MNDRWGRLTAQQRLRVCRWLGCSLLLVALLSQLGGASAQPAPAAVELAPAMPEAPRQNRAHGVFFARTQLVALPGGVLHLASTPDGRGDLCTDDQATIVVARGAHELWRWSHRFVSADRLAIECIGTQTIMLPPAAASYSATIVLEDVYPDTYGTRAYYLVPDPPAPTAEAAATPSPAPLVAPTQPAPIQPTAPPLATLATPVPDTPLGPRPARWPAIGLAAGFLAGLIGLIWLLRRAPAVSRQRARAIIELFDQETREARTIAVTEETTLIARRPLRAAPATALAAEATIASIQLSAVGALLRVSTALPNQAPIVLQPDQRYPLAGGVVLLRYRGDGAPPAAIDRPRPPAWKG